MSVAFRFLLVLFTSLVAIGGEVETYFGSNLVIDGATSCFQGHLVERNEFGGD